MGATPYIDHCEIQPISMLETFLVDTPTGMWNWLVGNPVFGDASHTDIDVGTHGMPQGACAVAGWDVKLNTAQALLYSSSVS